MLGLAVNAPAASDPYRLALPNYRFEFPRDHFNHPEFQTEWWYYTGNLRTAEGRRFGFELTFFRQAVDRQPAATVWDLKDVWMAHLALSDIDGGQFLHTERFNRTGPGIAGADLKQARVWNGNWQAQWTFDPSGAGRKHANLASRRGSLLLGTVFESGKATSDPWQERSEPEGGGRGQGVALYFLHAPRHHGRNRFGWKAIFRGRRELDGSRIFQSSTGSRSERLGLVQLAAGGPV